MNELQFIFFSLENIDDILVFSQVCKKWNEIYKKFKNEWYTFHTKIVENEGNEREIKIIGNRKYVTGLYQSGNKMYKQEYKDGKLEGKWIEYYENGNKKYEQEYKDGKLGEWIFWHSDGKVVKW